MEKLLLSLVSALLGFFFSQFFNLVAYYRIPKFRVLNHREGVLSAYSGDPPETPWEIELGVFLENFGRNPSKNTRIFVSNICVWNSEDGGFEETTFSFSELARPIDILPSCECVRVIFAKITGNSCCLEVPFESTRDKKENEFLSSSRFSMKFRAKVFVCCDDKNSSKEFVLEFDPSADEEWSARFLEVYDSVEFRRSIVMPKPA